MDGHAEYPAEWKDPAREGQIQSDFISYVYTIDKYQYLYLYIYIYSWSLLMKSSIAYPTAIPLKVYLERENM